MQNFTSEELNQLQTYIKMAQDMNAYRGYDQHIKDIQAEMQSKEPARSEEGKAQLQQELEAYQHAQRTFPQYLQDTYGLRSPMQVEARMYAIELVLYPRVIAHSPMRDTHEAIYDLRKQQRLEEWKQSARTPEEQAERTVQYAKEAMQAEQEYRRQHHPSGGDGTPPGNQGDPNLVRERQLLNDEFERQLEKYYEKQPEEKRVSLEEQYKQQQSSSKEEAKPGDEQQNITYEELYRRTLREPGRGDEPRREKSDRER